MRAEDSHPDLAWDATKLATAQIDSSRRSSSNKEDGKRKT